jgi:hypothetical protein
MIIAILGVVFLLVLLFVPIYYFWIREKAVEQNKIEHPAQTDEEQDN